MVSPENISQLAEKLVKSIPPGAKRLPQDLKKTFQYALQDALQKMDLVTQEEFEVANKVLARTREKLEKMEQQVAILEKSLADKS